MFNAIRAGLAKAGRSVGQYGRSGAYHLGARGTAGVAINRMSRMSNTGISSAAGAIAGGTYGAFSDNTSVLGGALMGAGIGAGAYDGLKAAKRASTYYGGWRAAGAGRGKSAYRSIMGTAWDAKNKIGPSLKGNKAMNSIGSTLKSTWDAIP